MAADSGFPRLLFILRLIRDPASGPFSGSTEKFPAEFLKSFIQVRNRSVQFLNGFLEFLDLCVLFFNCFINVNNLIKATTIYSVCHSKIYIIFSSAQDFSVSSL